MKLMASPVHQTHLGEKARLPIPESRRKERDCCGNFADPLSRNSGKNGYHTGHFKAFHYVIEGGRRKIRKELFEI